MLQNIVPLQDTTLLLSSTASSERAALKGGKEACGGFHLELNGHAEQPCTFKCPALHGINHEIRPEWPVFMPASGV